MEAWYAEQDLDADGAEARLLADFTPEERASLQHLNLNGNCLERLPLLHAPPLGLSMLTRLCLNGMWALADASLDPLLHLTRLTHLFFENSGLRALPVGITGLQRLRALFVSENELQSLVPLTALTRLEALWLANQHLAFPPALARNFGDKDYSEIAVGGGRARVQQHLAVAEHYMRAGPVRAVRAFLCCHRHGDNAALSALPRDVAVLIAQHVWAERMHPTLWVLACRHSAVLKAQRQAHHGPNKKLHRKKEKKPGTGIKVGASNREGAALTFVQGYMSGIRK